MIFLMFEKYHIQVKIFKKLRENMLITLERIQTKYKWITKSTHFEEIVNGFDPDEKDEEMNVEYDYPVCDESDDFKTIFHVINYWGVYEVPFEILNRLKDEDQYSVVNFLMELITDLSLKLFVVKYIHFLTSLANKNTFCENMARCGYLDMLKWGKKTRIQIKRSIASCSFGRQY